ncbi:MAG: FKBP-type peptidyl-prolyl cis-trans isomerase [Bifidobacteriaceae bacterium]|jgi:peptidylprolyl isomerase|nr:FKBP-type peptidyl-prolyl cis-trans isomerase [Bifidobacteriaceae bacterium]
MPTLQKPLAVLAALALAGGVASCSALAGSSPSSPPPSSPAASSPSADGLEQVEWVSGETPALEFDQPFELDQDIAVRVAKPGEGAEIEDGQKVTVNYVAYLGEDGSVIDSTYVSGEPYVFLAAAAATSASIFDYGVAGQKVGADVIVAWQADDGSSDTPTVYLLALSITGAETVPERAEGAAKPLDDPSLPTVTLDASGKPSITVPKGVDPPAELVQRVLIEGDGEAAEATDTVIANYTGWLWDGTQFDSSWDRGEPSQFGLQQVVAGWTEGLTGVKAGSQVLLVIPPDMGYGDEGNDTIPGGSTLIFVVDLLVVL